MTKWRNDIILSSIPSCCVDIMQPSSIGTIRWPWFLDKNDKVLHRKCIWENNTIKKIIHSSSSPPFRCSWPARGKTTDKKRSPLPDKVFIEAFFVKRCGIHFLDSKLNGPWKPLIGQRILVLFDGENWSLHVNWSCCERATVYHRCMVLHKLKEYFRPHRRCVFPSCLLPHRDCWRKSIHVNQVNRTGFDRQVEEYLTRCMRNTRIHTTKQLQRILILFD